MGESMVNRAESRRVKASQASRPGHAPNAFGVELYPAVGRSPRRPKLAVLRPVRLPSIGLAKEGCGNGCGCSLRIGATRQRRLVRVGRSPRSRRVSQPLTQTRSRG
jgi:hypothetical protein